MNSIKLMSLSSNNGYIDSIIIPNTDVDTIKRAINQLHTDNYVDSNCVEFGYDNKTGSYFDQVLWTEVIIVVTDIKTLKL